MNDQPIKQRLTLDGYLRTVAAGMDRLGIPGSLTGEERARAERAWAAGGRPGSFAREVKRTRQGLSAQRQPRGSRATSTSRWARPARRW